MGVQNSPLKIRGARGVMKVTPFIPLILRGNGEPLIFEKELVGKLNYYDLRKLMVKFFSHRGRGILYGSLTPQYVLEDAKKLLTISLIVV